MKWAKGQGKRLPAVLREGREALTGDNPNVAVFGRNDGGPIMNSGWTKYYALALPSHIIYDARVGAGLGFLARRYLEKLTHQPESVPEGLNFRWSTGRQGKGRKLQNPSSTRYSFNRLSRNATGSQAWARVNLWANWLLSQARAEARAAWCDGPDGLRKVEAALFMLGYDLTRATRMTTPLLEAA